MFIIILSQFCQKSSKSSAPSIIIPFREYSIITPPSTRPFSTLLPLPPHSHPSLSSLSPRIFSMFDFHRPPFGPSYRQISGFNFVGERVKQIILSSLDIKILKRKLWISDICLKWENRKPSSDFVLITTQVHIILCLFSYYSNYLSMIFIFLTLSFVYFNCVTNFPHIFLVSARHLTFDNG